MWEAATRVIDEFARDPDVRVLVVTGAGGKAFVSGADISKFEDERATEAAVARYNGVSQAFYAGLYDFPKPAIAQIQGYCIGGGLNLAISCDLRFCTEGSRFGLPAAKLGLGYGYAGLKRFFDTIGPSNTKDIFFSARQFGAAEALAMGIVNKVLPDAELAAFVRDYANAVADNAPLTINAIKQIAIEALKPESERNIELHRRPRRPLLRQPGLHRRPQRLPAKAQARLHRQVAPPTPVIFALPVIPFYPSSRKPKPPYPSSRKPSPARLSGICHPHRTHSLVLSFVEGRQRIEAWFDKLTTGLERDGSAGMTGEVRRSRGQITLALRSSAISLSAKPNSRSISSVCSPFSGGAATSVLGVRASVTGWPTTLSVPRSSPVSICCTMPRCATCGSANTLSIVLIGPQGTPASFSRSTHSALVPSGEIAAIAALSASRFLERAAAGGVVGVVEQRLGADGTAQALPDRACRRRQC